MERSRIRHAVGVLVAVVLLCVAVVAWRSGSRRTVRSGRAPVEPVRAPASERILPPVPWPRARPVALVTAETADDGSTANGLIEGRVVARGTGRGVPSAALTFLRDGSTRVATTDAHGEFRWTPDAEGSWTLLAVTAPGHLAAGGEPCSALMTVVARRGVAVRGVVVSLTEALRYEGMVRGPDGAPVADAEVRALDVRGDTWRSGPDGTFTFTADDETAFEVTRDGWAPGFATLDLAAQSSRRMTFRLGAATAVVTLHALSGMVIDAAGAPVSGALVTVRAQPEAVPHDAVLPGWRVRSFDDGTFRVEEVPPGRYEVTATDGVHAPARRSDVAPESGAVHLTMGVGRRIRGMVLDGRTGRPMHAFTVIAAAMHGIERVGAPVVRTVVDGAGEFELGGLDGGRYVVRAVASGYGASTEQSIDMDEPSPHVTLTLPTGGVIEGTVRDRTTQAPLDGARVSLEGHVSVADVPIDLVASTATDARGRFSLTGIAAGLRSVMAVAEGHHARVLSGLHVEDGRATDPLVIELTPVEDGGVPGIELAGIGAVLGARGDFMVVGRVIAGGGAAEVGLREGDAVLAVDGTPVRTLGFEGTIQRIRGPEGSVVRLTVQRGDAGAVEMAVPRRRIRT